MSIEPQEERGLAEDAFDLSGNRLDDVHEDSHTVDVLNLTELVRQSLKDAGYASLHDLSHATEEDLITKVDHLGRMGVQKIRMEMSKYGLTLGDNITVKERPVLKFEKQPKTKKKSGKWVCEPCGLTFKKPQLLGGHNRTKHPGYNKKKSYYKKMNKIQCELCNGLTFKNGPQKASHNRMFHPKPHHKWGTVTKKQIQDVRTELDVMNTTVERHRSELKVEYAVGFLLSGILTAIKSAHEGLRQDISLKELEERIGKELLRETVEPQEDLSSGD